MGLGNRISNLEMKLSDLERQLGALERSPTSMPTAGVKVAKAVAGPSAYPTTGNTFFIQFQDGEYTRAPGQTSGTFTDMATSAYCICYNIGETLPPEDSLVAVFNRDGYWWTYWAEPETP